jgi:hypothetical protein
MPSPCRDREVEATVAATAGPRDRARLEITVAADQGGTDQVTEVSTVIGTDDEEWWEGRDAASAAMKAQLEATGGFLLSVELVQGYASDGFGWFEARGSMPVDDGSVSMRMSGR